MDSLFHLDLSKTLVDVKLAMSFSPRVRDNKIIGRAYNSFLYIVSGSYTYRYRDGGFVAGEGDTVYLPAGSMPYRYHIEREAADEVRCLQLEFDLTAAASGKQLSFADRPMLLPAIHREAVHAAMTEAVAAYVGTAHASKLRALAALLQIFAIYECVDTADKMGAADRLIAPAKAYIEEHYREEISSALLAESCFTSESQLRRCFHAALGMSPMTYKKQLLLSDAKRLLSLGEFKIGEIAEMLGFYDIYAFSHFFKEMEGVSPREYADRLLKSR